MKKLILLAAILLSVKVFSQNFPKVDGSTLDDKKISLPMSNGKYSVIAIVYHRGAEDELKKWLNPLYNTFAYKSDKKVAIDISESYDVNFVFVPMISGFKQIKDDFKSTTEKNFWQYIVDTERSDMRAIQKQMKVEDTKIPYIYVIDKNGKIVETQSGSYNKAKMQKLEDAVDGGDD